MSCKKHVLHPKSFPVPAQLATNTSRNHCATNMAKGGTLQVQPKTTVSRPTKSPPGTSKHVLDLPINPSPRLMMMAKQVANSKPPARPRSIRPENAKVLKKSLSHNDIKILPNKSDSPKPKTQATVKRHSPSPTQQFKPASPKLPASKFSPKSQKAPIVKGRISDFQSKPAPSAPAPFADLVYPPPQGKHV